MHLRPRRLGWRIQCKPLGASYVVYTDLRIAGESNTLPVACFYLPLILQVSSTGCIDISYSGQFVYCSTREKVSF